MVGEARVSASAVVCRFVVRTVGSLGRKCAALLWHLRGGLSGGVACGWASLPKPSSGMTVRDRRRGIDAGQSVGLHCAAKALW
jgi:hypothetical protein